MLKDEMLYFIDFQGARLGPATYDLASLLYDPYVDLTEEIRESLMEQYLSMRKGADIVDLSKLEIRRAGLLRLMQAFGAYAKLSVLEGKASKFQAYLFPALDRISWLLNLYFSKEYPLILDFVSSVKLEREIMP
jgi:aminoglycoside/choline kinase family phosphotransferase